MAVAIPTSVMLSVFDGMADRLAHDLEDIVTRVFTTPWAYAEEEEEEPDTA